MRRARPALTGVVALLVGVGGVLALASCGQDDVDCSAMTTAVRYQVDPTTRAGLLTTTSAAAASAASRGYSTDQGTLFEAAPDPGRGLVAVRQVQLTGGSGDQLWTTSVSEARAAVQRGYADQGVVAYVSPTPSSCTVEVERFSARGVHRYATTPQEQQSLRGAGWDAEGSFYAAKPRRTAAPLPTAAGSPSPSASPTESSSASASPTPSPAPTAGQTLVDATFDDVQPGPVTPDSFNEQVGKASHDDAAYDSMTYLRNGDDRGGYVRTHLAAHKILAANDRHGDGNVLVVPLPVTNLDAACVAYDVRFSPTFAFAGGGKLPGLLGVAPGVSPGTPTGGGSVAHGWSGRVMWLGPAVWQQVRESGQPDLAVTYLYHPGQTGTYGDDIGWGQGFAPGTWHRVRQCYALNTIGRADGTLRAWLDGAAVLDRTDVVYRTDPKVHITHLDWSVFRGGNTLDWAADTGGDVDLDNLTVTAG